MGNGWYGGSDMTYTWKTEQYVGLKKNKTKTNADPRPNIDKSMR